jgi:hypothetical protein
MAWASMAAFLLAAATAASPSRGGSTRPLRVTMGPHVGFEPGTVRVTAYIQPNDNNRRLVVEADSGEHFTSSELPIDGLHQPLATSVWLKNLPAGEYVVVVRVQKAVGPDSVERLGFEVMPIRGER